MQLLSSTVKHTMLLSPTHLLIKTVLADRGKWSRHEDYEKPKIYGSACIQGLWLRNSLDLVNTDCALVSLALDLLLTAECSQALQIYTQAWPLYVSSFDGPVLSLKRLFHLGCPLNWACLHMIWMLPSPFSSSVYYWDQRWAALKIWRVTFIITLCAKTAGIEWYSLNLLCITVYCSNSFICIQAETYIHVQDYFYRKNTGNNGSICHLYCFFTFYIDCLALLRMYPCVSMGSQLTSPSLDSTL